MSQTAFLKETFSLFSFTKITQTLMNISSEFNDRFLRTHKKSKYYNSNLHIDYNIYLNYICSE